MADRVLNRPAPITVDLDPYHTTVLLTLRDPAGVTRLQDAAMTPLGMGRWTFLTPASLMDKSGVWEATVTENSNEIDYFTFAVGPRVPSGIAFSEMRFTVANQAGRAVRGRVTVADDLAITDSTLVGGAKNFRSHWLMLAGDSPEAGRVRRVVDYNGSALIVDTPFVTPPEEGTPFYLFRDNPDDIDACILTAVGDIAEVARVVTTVAGVPVIQGLLSVPAGLRDVMSIWTTVDNTTVELQLSEYTMLPGRLIQLSDTYSTVLDCTVTGVRSLESPRWEDSTFDVEPGVILSRAAGLLHYRLASGPGSDLDEHLRRGLVRHQEWDALMKKAVGRKHASRPVLN